MKDVVYKIRKHYAYDYDVHLNVMTLAFMMLQGDKAYHHFYTSVFFTSVCILHVCHKKKGKFHLTETVYSQIGRGDVKLKCSTQK